MTLEELALQVWEDDGGFVLDSWEHELDSGSQNARNRNLAPESAAVEERDACLV